MISKINHLYKPVEQRSSFIFMTYCCLRIYRCDRYLNMTNRTTRRDIIVAQVRKPILLLSLSLPFSKNIALSITEKITLHIAQNAAVKSYTHRFFLDFSSDVFLIGVIMYSTFFGVRTHFWTKSPKSSLRV